MDGWIVLDALRDVSTTSGMDQFEKSQKVYIKRQPSWMAASLPARIQGFPGGVATCHCSFCGPEAHTPVPLPPAVR